MEFGVQFFPDVGPSVKSAEQYWAECLELVDLFDELGYTHARTVEHHFQDYGGYSPSPHIFLSAASQRSKKARMITGAVLPIFNHPLKVAGEIGMLDAISGGRLECGFGRAFLPSEFEAFGRDFDESKARFAEGLEQVRLLLEQENVTSKGEFHSFDNVTVLPRPSQQPRPPFWIAAIISPDSFEAAGRQGHNLMSIPLTGGKMEELFKIYRDAWKAASHPGNGRIMLAHHMLCHEDDATAFELAKPPLERYLKSLVDAASSWMDGSSSNDYPGYDKIIEMLSKETVEGQMEKCSALIGSPEKITEQLKEYEEITGGYEVCSVQVNFNDISTEVAAHSMRLFSEKVMPHFS
jgi:alkanesulfonate monooxygenase SsuD/methylene tetrahydromethanopterin reductase-like flavin-dependent oxidoreductase (luciferase family)